MVEGTVGVIVAATVAVAGTVLVIAVLLIVAVVVPVTCNCTLESGLPRLEARICPCTGLNTMAAVATAPIVISTLSNDTLLIQVFFHECQQLSRWTRQLFSRP
jgi:hypothetical protein